MDCSDVKTVLSAYYDDGLSSDQRLAVASHLANCQDCSLELAEFGRLSTMAKELDHPQPPNLLWAGIEEQLFEIDKARLERVPPLSWRNQTKSPAVRLVVALAAAVLIMFGWFGYQRWAGGDVEHHMAADFAEYLTEFHRDPHAAQQMLLANYDGRALDPDRALHMVGYRPAVANGLPDNYAVQAVYIMDMPCCTCVQCLCQRSDGSTLAIFEHDDANPEWFGDRQGTEAVCHGQPCSLVTLDGRIAASWRRGQRHMTVVGAKDAAEIDYLVAWFDDRRQTE